MLDPDRQQLLEGLVHATRAAALVFAIRHARREREMLPVALFLGWIAVADLVRLWINRGPLAGLQGPFVGWPRVLGHLESALFISWHFGAATLARRVFAQRPLWPVALAYAAAVTALVLGYPRLRAENLARVYLAVELLCLGISFAAIISWAARRKPPRLAHACTAILVFMEAANLAGPYRLGVFGSWEMAIVVYILLYIGLALVQVLPLRFLAQER